jgi:DNA-binding NtrC family response regulator
MARVLVIDGDPAIREVLTYCLTFEAYEVEAVPELADGLDLLQHESFDLVLTDLPAPWYSRNALDSLDPLTRAAPLVPVVLATAYTQARYEEPARHGLADILIKPFELGDLLACLQHAIASNQERLRELQITADGAEARLRSAHEQAGRSHDLLRWLRG